MHIYNMHHKNAPADAVYIGRGSKWGNPYVIGKHGTREEVIKMYREDLEAAFAKHPEKFKEHLKELVGKDLVCFCKPKACHGDVLKEYVETLMT